MKPIYLRKAVRNTNEMCSNMKPNCLELCYNEVWKGPDARIHNVINHGMQIHITTDGLQATEETLEL